MALARYLEGESELGRVDGAADLCAVARLLTGAALPEAFLAAYAHEALSAPQETARRLIRSLNFSSA
ncbi:hypothetical protein [Nesterenkonia ebinurensis]|uniref:hypothetical protein n=1 Tax=Nesterenkonia ebinurensis TaxID=2608252 RepID=UPI00123D4986|nr:hypothetical protein [Nesterenkonia ebinurensis]